MRANSSHSAAIAALRERLGHFAQLRGRDDAGIRFGMRIAMECFLALVPPFI